MSRAPRPRAQRLRRAVLLALPSIVLLGIHFEACAPEVRIPGLESRVKVMTDDLGVPHIFAGSEHDAFFAQGYVHARDRFFQMDANRRAAAGTLAELTGSFVDLQTDAQARTLGIRQAAQRTLDLMEPADLALLHAYVDGVNAWLAANPLPSEYTELEVSAVPPWAPVDTLMLVKGASIDNVATYQIVDDALVQSYVAALGPAAGDALYHQDIARVAPWHPIATVPDATGEPPLAGAPARRRTTPLHVARKPSQGGPASRLALAPDRRASGQGSNVWGVASARSATGRPLVAADGHSPLTTPGEQVENHLVVYAEDASRRLSLSGTVNPGVPGVLSGHNNRVVWGWTSFYPDTSDVFRDRLLRGASGCATNLCIESGGVLHPVEEQAERYRLNLPDDGAPDSLLDVTSTVALIEPRAVTVLRVPFRSFGPIVEVTDPSLVGPGPPAETTALTIQYTGLHGGREPKGYLMLLRARDVYAFAAGLRHFTTTYANWVFADVEGNLAYLASGEIPLRADLEAGSRVGAPPWLVRDGTGPNEWIPDPARSQGQTLPFRVVPAAEMPQVWNPPSGFVVNCNEDPSGFDFDNDLLNQPRPSEPSAIFYLGSSATHGLRNSRVTTLLREKIDAGARITIEDMKRIQADTYATDASRFTPHLVAAFDRATRPGAPPELAALAADARVAEAVARLRTWDFTAPTGIAEGYDAADVDGVRNPVVSDEEVQRSVATTIYMVWRTKAVRSTIRDTLAARGLSPVYIGGNVTALLHLLDQDPFTGVGASGIDFFAQPASLPATDRRDVALLRGLRDALDALAGPSYEAAFGGSSRQDDYRWGRLNRVVLAHRLGGTRSIPPAAGFADLAPGLPGLARDGAADTVNQAFFAAGALPDGANGFVFDRGSTERLVMSPLFPSAWGAGILSFAVHGGGASGDPASPLHASQLGLWLTADYHEVPMAESDVRARSPGMEWFVPVR